MKQSLTISVFTSPLVRRIFLIFTTCALVPILSLTAVSYWQVTSQTEKQLRQTLRHACKNIGMSIFDSFSNFESELRSLSEILIKKNRDSLDTENLLSKDERDMLRALAIINAKKPPQTLLGSLESMPSPPELTSDSNLFFDDKPKKNARIFMSVRRNQPTDTYDHLLAELNPAAFLKQPLRALPTEAQISILTSGGQQIYTSIPFSAEIAKTTLKLAEKNSSGQFQWDKNQKSYLASYWTIFLQGQFISKNLIVLLIEEKHQAVASIKTFTRNFLQISALTLVLILLLSSIYVRRTLYPLAELQRGARLIGSGDFSKRVLVKSHDEFKELADSFNTMATHIEDHIQGLNRASHTVRLILSALDRQKLTETVLQQLQKVIPYRMAGFSILTADCLDTIQTQTLNGLSPMAEFEESVTILSNDELKALHGAEDYLLLNSDSSLPNLLAPLLPEEGDKFFCLPLLHNGTFSGCISLKLDHLALPPVVLLRVRQIADQVVIALDNIRLVEELDQLNWGTLQALARTVDANSPWTAGHSERVALLALKIGEKIGLNNTELDLLHRGALLHDIGKIGSPTSILDKPTALTDEEYKLLQEHPVLGAKILEPIGIYRNIIPMIRHHHEKYDGTGYPDGLAGLDICRDARILVIADIFDALISDRPYRRGWEIEKLQNYLAENSKKIFDPEILSVFLNEVLPELDLKSYHG